MAFLLFFQGQLGVGGNREHALARSAIKETGLGCLSPVKTLHVMLSWTSSAAYSERLGRSEGA